MITMWVVTRRSSRRRRTHRWCIGDNKTVCGLHARGMMPITTRYRRNRWMSVAVVHNLVPNFCHECFKYRYRHDSMKGM